MGTLKQRALLYIVQGLQERYYKRHATMDDATNLGGESSLTGRTGCDSRRVVLSTGIDRPEINAFTSGMNNFDACFPFVSNIAVLCCSDLQHERRKRLKLKDKNGPKRSHVWDALRSNIR